MLKHFKLFLGLGLLSASIFIYVYIETGFFDFFDKVPTPVKEEFSPVNLFLGLVTTAAVPFLSYLLIKVIVFQQLIGIYNSDKEKYGKLSHEKLKELFLSLENVPMVHTAIFKVLYVIVFFAASAIIISLYSMVEFFEWKQLILFTVYCALLIFIYKIKNLLDESFSEKNYTEGSLKCAKRTLGAILVALLVYTVICEPILDLYGLYAEYS